MAKEKILNKPGIYLITNKLSGKSYCGQSVMLKTRISSHKRADTDQVIHSAIRKHGVDNFEFRVLLYCDESMLNFYEIECIKIYNCKSPLGYNCNNGGAMDDVTLNDLRYRRKNNITERKHKKGHNLTKEARTKMSKSNIGENNSTSKEVEDITGRIWVSCKAASKDLDCSSSMLSQMLNSRPTLLPHLHYLDLHFVANRPENYEYKTMEEIEHLKVPRKVMVYKKSKEERKKTNLKRVIDDQGRSWNSVSECAEFFGVNKSKLCMMLKGERNFVEEVNGIGLRYENEEHKNKVFRSRVDRSGKRPKSRRVIDKDGKIYKSARECAKLFDIGENKLSAMLRGVFEFRCDLVELELKYMDEYKPKNWTGKPSARKGTKNSEETRQKIKDALSKMKNNNSRIIIDNAGREWCSIKEAALDLNIPDYTLGKMLMGVKLMRSDLVSLELRYK